MKTPPLVLCLVWCVLLLMLATAPTTAAAQTWTYKSYKKDRASGQYDKDRFVSGTIRLEDEADGQARFRMIAGAVDVCYRGAVPVTVERSAELLVITSQQPVAGCEVFRYQIRTDGSGGFKEVKRDGSDVWVKTRFDHGLLPVP